ncbi:MAG: VOC family protein [Bauldia sp.]|nr:VOC family protein [Bauldia sp.]
MAVTRLIRVSITVADLDRAIAFFRDGLGLRAGAETTSDDPATFSLLGLDTAMRARSVDVAAGEQAIELVAFDPPGAPYPTPRASNDQWFEHIALVAGDIAAVWQTLERQSPEPITAGTPDRLPPNTGSVTAFKFRDHEGHPLELIAFPAGVGDPRWQDGGPGVRGYDHTAIAVTDVERSLAFYQGLLGFRSAGRSLNQGPEQERLDGLEGCVVDVVALAPTVAPTPHVELLHYRSPAGRVISTPTAASDVAATRQVHAVEDLDGMILRLQAAKARFLSPGPIALRDGSRAVSVRDPDGHMIVLMETSATG